MSTDDKIKLELLLTTGEAQALIRLMKVCSDPTYKSLDTFVAACVSDEADFVVRYIEAETSRLFEKLKLDK